MPNDKYQWQSILWYPAIELSGSEIQSSESNTKWEIEFDHKNTARGKSHQDLVSLQSLRGSPVQRHRGLETKNQYNLWGFNFLFRLDIMEKKHYIKANIAAGQRAETTECNATSPGVPGGLRKMMTAPHGWPEDNSNRYLHQKSPSCQSMTVFRLI